MKYVDDILEVEFENISQNYDSINISFFKKEDYYQLNILSNLEDYVRFSNKIHILNRSEDYEEKNKLSFLHSNCINVMMNIKPFKHITLCYEDGKFPREIKLYTKNCNVDLNKCATLYLRENDISTFIFRAQLYNDSIA